MDGVPLQSSPSYESSPIKDGWDDEAHASYEPFRDRFNRVIGSLRVSVTDRCNFRCLYCMPKEDMFFMQRSEILSFEEIIRVTRLFAMHGVKKIRFTGGEPTVRRELPTLISRVREETGVTNLALTTNGVRLPELSHALHDAGIRTVNISLDTLNPKKFRFITQRDLFDKTMLGIKTAISTGFDRVKLNVVCMRSFNLSEVHDFIQFALDHEVTVRFIEFMPFTGNQWDKHELVPSSELRERIMKKYDLREIPLKDVSQTSREYMINGNSKARVGFISSVTESFCSACNRVRLTADGKLRPCLHSPFERDLRGLLRNGASDDELVKVIRETIWHKSKGHEDFLASQYRPPENDREMMRIGG